MTTPNLLSTLKSADTEERIDILFYRPMGYRMALLAKELAITPNQITIASMFIGVAAGSLFYSTTLWVNLFGMLLLILANVMDSADGQLARMTGQMSQLGRWLDGICGDLWFGSIYLALGFRLMTDHYSILIWLFLAITGYFHTKQAALADYYRNFHLMFLKNKKESEFDRSLVQKEKYDALSWRKEFVNSFLHFGYYQYTRGQENLTPDLQRFYGLMRDRNGDDIPQPLRTEFREASKPLMKYANILSFNTRVIALFISLFMGMPILYFVFEITVLNGLLVYMWLRHEQICSHFYTKLFRNAF